MGRAPCCEKVGLKKGRWTKEEDELLAGYIAAHGEGSWRSLPKSAGLLRCGKSCRLRWINYLRSDVKRGNITEAEEDAIVKLHSALGNKWSLIAGQLPGRTDNEIKNYWNSHLSRRVHSFRPLPVDVAATIELTKLANSGTRRGSQTVGPESKLKEKNKKKKKRKGDADSPLHPHAADEGHGTVVDPETPQQQHHHHHPGTSEVSELATISIWEATESCDMDTLLSIAEVRPTDEEWTGSARVSDTTWDLMDIEPLVWAADDDDSDPTGRIPSDELELDNELQALATWLLSDTP